MKDRIIETNLAAALATARALDGCNVTGTMCSGVATLRGTVDDHRTRQIAEEIARRLYGVMTVRNELVVNPSDWGDEHAPPSTEFEKRGDAAAVTSTRFRLTDSL